MADYSITASSVAWVSGSPATLSPAVANEAMTAGTPFFFNTSISNQANKSDANVAGLDKVDGIVLTQNVAIGQYFAYAPAGATINPGATMAAADVVVLSNNTGRICPVADLASGSNLTIIGYATGTQSLYLLTLQSSVTR